MHEKIPHNIKRIAAVAVALLLSVIMASAAFSGTPAMGAAPTHQLKLNVYAEEQKSSAEKLTTRQDEIAEQASAFPLAKEGEDKKPATSSPALTDESGRVADPVAINYPLRALSGLTVVSIGAAILWTLNKRKRS